MNTNGLPWDRLSVIPEIVYRFTEKGCPALGKTTLQKIIYLLQGVSGKYLGYDFSLYTYGPFDSQVLQDLDFIENMKGVTITQISGGCSGVSITPAESTDDIRNRSNLMNDPIVQSRLQRLILDFGNLSAKEMELRSTLFYVYRDSKRRNEFSTKESVVSLVQEIKPRFDISTIKSAFEELKDKKYIEFE
ncbi:MAG: hypothetical protein WCJ56_13055 [bacterium]